MNENSTLTPVVLSKKRELTSPDSPPDQKKNKFYKSPVSAGAVTEINMSHEPEDTVGDEFLMDTEGATGVGDDIGTSGDKQIYVRQGSQQPNLNITLKEGDLIGISVQLKESFRGELRDEMRLEMGIMIKSIVDGVLKGFNEKVDALNVRIDSLKTENTSLKKDNDKLKTRVSKLETTAEAAEQYSRRNCLRISGYKERENENTDNIILEMTSKLNVDLN